ncbi:MAG: branched-chain amino acid ABC transporter permease [Anaerolineales bacterium]|nr:branched-chain amino acid ABC transporter permease [Anaerolineales bacterium]
MEIIVQNIVSGIMIGALYGLAAVGLSLVFGVLKILNVAHGELIMIGGYTIFWLFSLYGMDPILSLVIVIPILFLIGMLLQLELFSHVVKLDEENRIKNSLLIGFGLTLVLQNMAIQLWTADERSVVPGYATVAFDLFGIRFPVVRLVGLVVAFLTVAALEIFLNRSLWGKAIRATAEDWQTAALTGINIKSTYLFTFGLGASLAGIAGALVIASFSVSPFIGLQWTLKALIVVVLAGLGSIGGVLAAGILLGVSEALSAYAFGGEYRELVGLILFLIVLSFRPQGLFGGKG